MTPKTLLMLLWVALAVIWTPPPAAASSRPVVGPRRASDVVMPLTRVRSAPVPHDMDSADDPAIWIHPTETERSLVLGTDKRGGLLVYKMDGGLEQVVSDGTLPNNVDVLYGFKLAGKQVDIAIASCRGNTSRGVKVWTIDPVTGTLSDATAGKVIPVLGGGEPQGLCGYHSARHGKFYFFVTDKYGHVDQYELHDAGGERVRASRVRALTFGSETEGCVADDELEYVYVAEERTGIWKLGAEPGAVDRRTLVARVGEHGLAADVEGLALYGATGGRGYLIGSSQGNSCFKVYAREGNNRYLLTIDPRPGKEGDDVEHTDGIAVTNSPTSGRFPKGVLVAQDGDSAGRQDFHFFAWEDIAGTRLLVDTLWSPRTQGAITRRGG